jgi:Calcineurin-like phosphoesterase
VNTFADLLVSNLLQLNLKPDYLCTDALDMCPQYDSGYVELNESSYADQVLASKPQAYAQDDFVDRLYAQIAADPKRSERPTLKFLHFTDIHMDPYYNAGANKSCQDVICCRATDGFPTDPVQQAGILGSFGCDVPFDVVTRMGEIVNREIKPDVILWTGDIVPHDQNSYTFEYVSGLQKQLADFFRANFSSYQIYPLEGNHDFVTPNSQDFRQPDPMLAFNLKQWAEYLEPEAQEVYAQAGYYS